MTTDTQTAFVMVPREPDKGMLTAALRSVSGIKITDPFGYDADPETVLRLAIRSALSAAPKPPESEIGPVAWRVYLEEAECWTTALLADADNMPDGADPLYPQARIDADAAIIAGLRAEVERLQECAATWEHNWKSERDVKLDCISRVKAADARAEAAEAEVAALKHDVESSGALRLRLNAYRDRAKVAEARVKELEEALEPFADFADFLAIETEGFSDTDELRLFLDESDFELYRLKVASFRRARAALASKKETVDG